MAFVRIWGRASFITAMILSTMACSNNLQFPTLAEKTAPQNMLESFSNVEKTSDVCDKAHCIKIQKSSFGKIYLLLASGITLGSAPQWYDMKPLVVSFKHNKTDVALVAENFTSIYKEIQGQMLLQSFKVVAEDEDSVTFDWGRGLTSIIAQTPYDVDAPRSQTDLTESSLPTIPVADSFVENVKLDEANIELIQLSKIITQAGSIDKNLRMNFSTREESLTMNIQIRPYDLGADFKAKNADATRRVGFFVTKVSKPGLSQDVANLITKWDLSPAKGPITVRISNAVPADYVGAVVEAVGYWNKVFGRDVLVAKPGVDPLAGPEHRSIMIRWLPWLDAGAAYAMGQSDPLTGETLRAQVFMPAVFTRVGSGDLVKFNGGSPVATIGSAIACDFTQSLKKLNELAREKSDSQRLRLAQDSVRATVAHELGHALGLRHNFAGSYSAKVSTAEVVQSAANYFKDPQHPGVETSTSIMDYVSGVDNILMAAKIKYQALSYDKMAMDWAYSDNDKALNEKISKYCTDDDISLANSQGLNIYGCERFDAGNNPLLRKYLEAKDEKEGLVNVLFASIIGRMYPSDDQTAVKNLDQVLAETKKWGLANFDSLEFVVNVLTDRKSDNSPAPLYVSLESVKSGQLLYAKFGVDPQLAAQRSRQLQEAGGMGTLLRGLGFDAQGQLDIFWFNKQVEALKNSAFFSKGTTLSGREYQLSADQQKKILAFYNSFISSNMVSYLNGLLTFAPKLNNSEKDDAGNPVKITTQYADKIITEQDTPVVWQLVDSIFFYSATETASKVGPGLAKEIKLPQRLIPVELRAKYLPLLSSTMMRAPMATYKNLLREKLLASIADVVKEADPALDVRTLSEAELRTVPETLQQKNLADKYAVKWLETEIGLYLETLKD